MALGIFTSRPVAGGGAGEGGLEPPQKFSRFLRVCNGSLAVSSQQPPKKKSKQVENKQGTLLSWVKPCTSDTEPGVVEETIRIKEQPESNCLASPLSRLGK